MVYCDFDGNNNYDQSEINRRHYKRYQNRCRERLDFDEFEYIYPELKDRP